MDSEDMRLQVYEAFASSGRPPTPDELAATNDPSRPEVSAILAELADARHLVLGDDDVVATRCPSCGRALAWDVGRDAPPDGTEVAHFQTPAAAMWDDVVTTCSNQRLFCSEHCVDRHLDREGLARGYLMDLGTLWRLASHWYDGRLARGYQRRDPVEAKAYLREVGVTGPFWGLE